MKNTSPHPVVSMTLTTIMNIKHLTKLCVGSALLASGLHAATFSALDIGKFCNVSAFSEASSEEGLDGNGFVYPALRQFPVAGELVDLNGMPFRFPDYKNINSALQPDGQEISLSEPGNYPYLFILGTSVGGPTSGSIEIVYTNETPKTLSYHFSDWCNAAVGSAEKNAIIFSARIGVTGGAEATKPFIRSYSLPLPAGNIKKIRFLKNEQARIFAASVSQEAPKNTGGPLDYSADKNFVVKNRVEVPDPGDSDKPVMPRHRLLPGAAGDDILVGFVDHYPFNKKGMKTLTKIGATSDIFRISWLTIETAENTFDFSGLQKQIDYAEKYDQRNLVLVFEVGPVHRPGWLQLEVVKRGEAMEFADGKVHTDPSISSKYYAERRKIFIQKACAYIKEHDKNHRIAAYQNGAEWWYISPACYNKGDRKEFQKWLNAKYAGEKVSPDVVEPNVNLSLLTSPIDLAANKMSARRDYTFSTWVKAGDTTYNLVSLDVVLFKGDGNNDFTIISSETVSSPSADWQPLKFDFTIPTNVTHVVLHLKFKGIGTVYFDDVQFYEKLNPQENLAPNPGFEIVSSHQAVGWGFVDWSKTAGVKTSGQATGQVSRTGKYSLMLTANADAAQSPEKHATAYDWQTWSYEYVAGFIKEIEKEIRANDDTRRVGTYLTFSFARLAEWEDMQGVNIFPEKVFKDTTLDYLGMQICSAQGDWSRITSALDLTRKHNKPMWAVDLLDFTSGVALGYDKMNKVTQATIQHGGKGIYYYCWWGTPDYNFYTGMTNEDLATMLNDARNAMVMTRGKAITSEIMLVNTYMPFSSADPNGMKNDFRDLYGWYKILSRDQLWFDMYSLYELQETGVDQLKPYKLVVLPDACYLTAKVRQVLDEYVKSGGHLLVSGRLPGIFDETGKSGGGLESLGIEAGKMVRSKAGNSKLIPKNGLGLPEDLILRGNYSYYLKSVGNQGMVTAGKTEEGGAILTVAPYGRGAVVWTGQDNGAFYLGNVKRQTFAGNTPPLYIEQPEAVTNKVQAEGIFGLVNGWMKYCGLQKEVAISPVRHDVEVVRFSNETERMYFFVNNAGGQAGSCRAEFYSEKQPLAVKVMTDYGEERNVRFTYENRRVAITLPAFEATTLVRLF
jgi:hypothetical protein